MAGLSTTENPRVTGKELPGAVGARHARILSWLVAEGRLDVISLAGRLGVAQETIRRDLKGLEADGRLQRVHGGAVPAETDPFPALASPTCTTPDDLAAASALWVRLPRTGTVLLGTGPLTLALVAVMSGDPPPSPGLTVVSTSLDAAIAAARIDNVAVYNIGGTVTPDSRAQEGDWALQELGRLQVDISVVCPTGISFDHGLGQSTPPAAAVSRAEVGCGQNVIVLADAAAIGRPAFVQFATWREIDTVMLSGRPAAGELQPFRERGVEVVTTTAVDQLVGTPDAGARSISTASSTGAE